jgi:hypothetical protein
VLLELPLKTQAIADRAIAAAVCPAVAPRIGRSPPRALQDGAGGGRASEVAAAPATAAPAPIRGVCAGQRSVFCTAKQARLGRFQC